MDTYQGIIRFFCDLNPILCQGHQEEKELWVDEPMPLLLALSTFGRLIASHVDVFTSADLALVSDAVEKALTSGDEYLDTAMATGFLEAVLSIWDEDSRCQRVIDALGPEAIGYCEAWNERCGISRRLRG